MYLRTVLATSASIPFFAAFIAEREGRVSEDLIAVAYFLPWASRGSLMQRDRNSA